MDTLVGPSWTYRIHSHVNKQELSIAYVLAVAYMDE